MNFMRKDPSKDPASGSHSSVGTPLRCFTMKSPVCLKVSVLNSSATQASAIGSLWSHAKSPKHILVGIVKGETAKKPNFTTKRERRRGPEEWDGKSRRLNELKNSPGPNLTAKAASLDGCVCQIRHGFLATAHSNMPTSVPQ